jgi:hypothetical protein
MFLRTLVLCTAVATATIALNATAASAQLPQPVLVSVGQADQQDVPAQSTCEPDTLVEPDVAIDPLNPDFAVAAAHDCRFPDGGAVDISYAWTHDGGLTWNHAPLPGITKAVGGQWDRASDPVVAWGPDGSVYISVLDISLDCPSGVSVSRSTDGGQTFGPPVLAHYSDTCKYSDDKNWLVIDNGANSPYRGRLYQFWTPFLRGKVGHGSQQVVRWSDDHGQTWSKTVALTPRKIYTQDSQPGIQPDGTIVDTYLSYGKESGGEAPESRIGSATLAPIALAAKAPADTIRARTSHDGGKTWSAATTVTTQAGEGPAGIRCCLPSAVADPVTGRLYASWISPDSGSVVLESSADGTHWSAPSTVTAQAGNDYVNVDVSAYQGEVFVSTGRRDLAVENGRYVQQELLTSFDGTNFGAPLTLGPLSDLDYAAQAGGIFPGDYIGSAAGGGRLYTVWCLSSQPADPNATYHQVMYAAALQT